VITGCFAPAAAFVIGGRDGTSNHSWHGLIDDVRLTGRVLTPDQLLLASEGVHEATIGYWRFDAPRFFADSAAQRFDLRPPASSEQESEDAALTDLCHVLLNANEFLYID
jgi:hypothetical protein